VSVRIFSPTNIRNSASAFTRSHGIRKRRTRSRDGGNSWQEIENGLPSNFGFGLTVNASGDVFIVPLQADGQRFTCEGKLRVYRSRDEGDTWEALSNGLPQENAYEVILRDAVGSAGDEVFFGTKNGKLFHSPDGGDSWTMIEGSLPEINCVRAFNLS
jgi:photosystem II stability/assembly factor-like uncharacterized protein